MRKVALISSFCDTKEKNDVLINNLKILKELGIDSIVISPFPLSQEIINQTTYFFKTNDNPVLDWPFRAMYTWKEIYIDGETYRIAKTYADYGWAGLYQVKQLSEIGLILEYDQYFHMIYDLKIDSEVINFFKSNKTCSLFPSKRDTTIWEVGLHFMIFDKINLKRFISFIHLDSYFNMNGGHAFTWLKNLRSFFPYELETKQVEDWIYYYDGHDFYNYSPTDEFNMFIIKDDQLKDSVKLLFYDVKSEQEIKVIINSNKKYFNMKNYSIFDIELNAESINSIILEYKEKNYNITDTINKIKHNTITKW